MPTNKSINRMFLVTVALYIGASMLISRVLTVNLPTIAALLISQALILLPAVCYCLWKRVPLRELIPFRRMKFSVWILVIVCTYLMYPLLIVLNALTLFFVDSGTTELLGITQGNFLLSVLLIALLPACVEEFMFRGMLFGTYRRSRMLPAIFLSAFLFGCMHMNFNQFLYAFMLGIYMAFLVEATGSILSSVLAHFTINFTGTVMSYLLPKIMESLGQAGDAVRLREQMNMGTGSFLHTMDQNSLIFMAVGLIIWGIIALGTTAGAVGIYIAIARISGRMEHIKRMMRQGTRERIFSISLLLAILLMAAMMALPIIFG